MGIYVNKPNGTRQKIAQRGNWHALFLHVYEYATEFLRCFIFQISGREHFKTIRHCWITRSH